MVRIHYFAVMVTVVPFFYESQVEELRKAFTNEKKRTKSANDFLWLYYYFFLPKFNKKPVF